MEIRENTSSKHGGSIFQLEKMVSFPSYPYLQLKN